MRTLGIDLAAQPANTSACTIDWGPGRPIVSGLRSGLDDDTLLDAIEGADKVAIDAPFGWPDEFVEAVSAHRNRAGWPGRGEDQDIYRFQPVEFGMKDIEMIHGTNEHMTLKNLEKMVQFYARLIPTAAQ